MPALPVGLGRRPAPARCPTPRPSTCPAGAGSTCSTSSWSTSQKPFEERDFADIAELGFDFVRLPLDYRCWTDRDEPEDAQGAGPQGDRPGGRARPQARRSRPDQLPPGPGFHRRQARRSRSRSGPTPRSWTICAHHWASFAARYQGIPNNLVSFNLFNEPDDKVKPEDHRRVVERVAAAIRERDPQRLIVCDGRAWATTPPTELIGLNVAAALHDYNPMPLTHYKASWVNWDESWPEPIWPLKQNDGKYVVRGTIARELIKPWKDFEAKGVGVMVGEFGVYNQTPHRFVLSWMNDTLAEFKKAGWGWALWNFTGSFGICDSGRYDVAYEDLARPQARPGHARIAPGGLMRPPDGEVVSVAS